ncbi:MAG TPA: hypothetical protein PLJ21_07925 [Pseudobdellovibrionaceae bacterium]|nr:hypothetical protein [Pseudobdellovibrionaceae bacterium]
MNLFYQTVNTFKKVGYILFPIMVLSLVWERFTTQQIYIEMNQTSPGPSLLWIWGVLSLINGFFSPVFMLMITIYAIEEKWQMTSPFNFLKTHTAQVLIETMRALGKVFLGFIFLIIPGVWLHIKYIFVPFIVLESESYAQGEQDALSYSSTLTRKKMGSIIILLSAFNIFLPLIMTQFFDEYRTLWKTPFSSLALSLIDTLFYICFTLLFYKTYLQTKKEGS